MFLYTGRYCDYAPLFLKNIAWGGVHTLVQTLCHKRSNSFLDKIVFTPKTVWSNSFFGVVKIIWSGFYSGSNWFYSGSKLYNFYPPPGGKNYGGKNYLEGVKIIILGVRIMGIFFYILKILVSDSSDFTGFTGFTGSGFTGSYWIYGI